MLNWKEIEEKWQKRWKESKIFETDPDYSKPKYYLTVAYPYPNSPQHIGHGRTYTLTDVHARYMRMQGCNVLFPMAWHFTGTPVIAMVERLRKGDEELIDTFLNVYKIPEESLSKLETPIDMARYFAEEIKYGMQRMGFSIDWRREFTTIDPYYSKFIEWQFEKLRQKGYITQGSHPVGWCPNCGNPVGQHDTVGDVEPEIEEFTVIKFKSGDDLLPAATLRPETVFGVTNIWLNPDAIYVKALVDNESWIVSEAAVKKLRFLERVVEVKERCPGIKLMGKKVVNPANNKEVPILPADFVDPDNATGVVMSVPAHAPYDLIALDEILSLSKNELERRGIQTLDKKSLEPVPVIELPGYGGVPARHVVLKLKITRQSDPLLNKATQEVYSQEFRNGRMLGNTGVYSGLPVEKAKEIVKEDLLSEGKATIIHELIEPVKCRCGSEVIVKIFKNQWFIDYGNRSWKKIAHEALAKMDIIPRELRQEYDYVIDWLKAKACARKAGIGTKLPWEPDWIIEALSDSTIYMAFYTLCRKLKELKPEPASLNLAFWDYIFLGEGDAESVASSTKTSVKDLEELRGEFKYFYPLDCRHSGRDLIPNHLTFMIFNHVGIFPNSLWPKGIAVNGSVLMEGQKMSKSLNNIIPLISAIERYGADPLRLSLMITAEPIKDADFSEDIAKTMRENLEKYYSKVIEILKTTSDYVGEFNEIDRWMLSRLQSHIKEATESMAELKVRKTIHAAFYNLNQDLDWYMRRVEPQKKDESRRRVIDALLRRVLNAQVRLLAPFTPHICEELWEAMGGEGFVSFAKWPEVDESLIRPDIEEMESALKLALADVENIVKATNLKPSRIIFYVATSWKWKVYLKALELASKGRLDVGSLVKECFKDDELKTRVKEIPDFSRDILEDVRKMPGDTLDLRISLGAVNEFKQLQDAAGFLSREFQCEVTIYDEADPWIIDPKKRAERAKPYKPAIYVE